MCFKNLNRYSLIKLKKKKGPTQRFRENTTERLGVEYSHVPFVSD
jgi:hypothetical protein